VAVDVLERGRTSYARRAWADAHASLAAADRAAPLGPDDLQLLATSAYMLGRVDEFVQVLERAHQAHLEGGEPLRAARWDRRPAGSAAPTGSSTAPAATASSAATS
jgi:hypothetical protein